MNINLDGTFSVTDNVIELSTEHSQTTYRLPKGTRRVTVERAGAGRKRLILGGFKTITVMVTGPGATIEKLREAVL